VSQDAGLVEGREALENIEDKPRVVRDLEKLMYVYEIDRDTLFERPGHSRLASSMRHDLHPM
jgi:hypothetical protein